MDWIAYIAYGRTLIAFEIETGVIVSTYTGILADPFASRWVRGGAAFFLRPGTLFSLSRLFVLWTAQRCRLVAVRC